MGRWYKIRGVQGNGYKGWGMVQEDGFMMAVVQGVRVQDSGTGRQRVHIVF